MTCQNEQDEIQKTSNKKYKIITVIYFILMLPALAAAGIFLITTCEITCEIINRDLKAIFIIPVLTILIGYILNLVIKKRRKKYSSLYTFYSYAIPGLTILIINSAFYEKKVTSTFSYVESFSISSIILGILLSIFTVLKALVDVFAKNYSSKLQTFTNKLYCHVLTILAGTFFFCEALEEMQRSFNPGN